MAPTQTELFDQLSKWCHLSETAREQIQDDADNLVGLLDTFVQSLEGDTKSIVQRAAACDQFRSACAVLLSTGLFRAGADSILRDLARLYNFTDTGIRQILGRLYVYFHDNSITVQSRALSADTPTFSGATGDGAIYCLSTDAYNRDIEGFPPIGSGETWTAECIRDQLSGADKNYEVFRVQSYRASPDGLEWIGSGINQLLTCVGERDSAVYLRNPGWSSGESGVSVPGWTFDAGAVATTSLDTSNTYITDVGKTAVSLDLGAQSVTLSQTLNARGVRLDQSVPYIVGIPYNRAVNSDAGTLTITVGSQSSNVVLSAQTGWNVLYLALGQKCWYRVFQQNNAKLSIGWSRSSGAGLLLGRLLFAPMTQIGGLWYAAVGGATPFALEDTATWAHTETGAIVQTAIARHYRGAYLPHAASTPTVSEP